MPLLVTNGAMLMCSSGTAPSVLSVVPPMVTAETQPAANIQDFVPMLNIKPFGTCNVLTAQAGGVPTPCVPATSPWTLGSPNVTIRGMPALNQTSLCTCSIGGVITVSMPGTTKSMVA